MNKRDKLGYLEGIVSIIINLLLFVIKYWAGIVSGSVAMIADAWHTLSDSISSLIVIVGIKLSSKKPDAKRPFGYGRWEQISAIFIGFLLGIVAYEFMRESIDKFNSQESANFGTVAIVVTIISIVMKEALAQFAFRIGKKTDNTAIKADAWHHRSDAISSVIILIGIFLRDKFWWIDSLLGILVSLLLFYAVFDIVKSAIRKLLGEDISAEMMKKILNIVDESSDIALNAHHFHIHNYGVHQELTFHVQFKKEINIELAHTHATNIEKAIFNQLGIETTIHIEPAYVKHD